MSAGLERYELLDRIGAGGMGEVYRGRAIGEHGFAKTVAIKRVLPEQAHDSRLIIRLVEEAKLAVTLTHANLVQVLDLCRAHASSMATAQSVRFIRCRMR